MTNDIMITKANDPTTRMRSRTNRSILRTAAALSFAGSIAVGSAGAAQAAGIQPETRERVVLANISPWTGEICTDWTNEDGTHGTNCPEVSYPKTGFRLNHSEAGAQRLRTR